MRKGLVLATLVLGGATAAEAQIIDMSAIYPGPLALTHTLLATDGRHYSFSGDTVSGVWSRSIDPGYIDYHVWEPDGMYYMGWLTPGELHWAAPPSFAFPRFWDQAPWTRTAPYTLAHRTAAGDTIASYDLTISLRRVVIKEERLSRRTGGCRSASLSVAVDALLAFAASP